MTDRPWWRQWATRIEWFNVFYLVGIILAASLNNLLAAGMWTVGYPLGYAIAAVHCAKERRRQRTLGKG